MIRKTLDAFQLDPKFYLVSKKKNKLILRNTDPNEILNWERMYLTTSSKDC